MQLEFKNQSMIYYLFSIHLSLLFAHNILCYLLVWLSSGLVSSCTKKHINKHTIMHQNMH